MTETNRIRTLVATLRDALPEIDSELGLTREGVDAIGQEAVRLREGLAALGALRRREDASVGIDMVIDAAVALLQAFHDLELALPDAQADVETLEAEMEEDEDAGDV
jgi:hypothetical protein